jgi:hypothetical protein
VACVLGVNIDAAGAAGQDGEQGWRGCFHVMDVFQKSDRGLFLNLAAK